VTLYDYLLTIDADYDNPGTKVVVTTDEATDDMLDASTSTPLLVVRETSITPMHNFQTTQVFEKLIDVLIYQKAGTNAESPSKALVQAVWDAVLLAPLSVDENFYGEGSFIQLKYISGVSPHHDMRSGGVEAALRFSLHFARQTSS
jgi:hypothetical protein